MSDQRNGTARTVYFGHAGDLGYFGVGKRRLWIYVEWGDGVRVKVGRASIYVRAGWSRV